MGTPRPCGNELNQSNSRVHENSGQPSGPQAGQILQVDVMTPAAERDGGGHRGHDHDSRATPGEGLGGLQFGALETKLYLINKWIPR